MEFTYLKNAQHVDSCILRDGLNLIGGNGENITESSITTNSIDSILKNSKTSVEERLLAAENYLKSLLRKGRIGLFDDELKVYINFVVGEAIIEIQNALNNKVASWVVEEDKPVHINYSKSGTSINYSNLVEKYMLGKFNKFFSTNEKAIIEEVSETLNLKGITIGIGPYHGVPIEQYVEVKISSIRDIANVDTGFDKYISISGWAVSSDSEEWDNFVKTLQNTPADMHLWLDFYVDNAIPVLEYIKNKDIHVSCHLHPFYGWGHDNSFLEFMADSKYMYMWSEKDIEALTPVVELAHDKIVAETKKILPKYFNVGEYDDDFTVTGFTPAVFDMDRLNLDW